MVHGVDSEPHRHLPRPPDGFQTKQRIVGVLMVGTSRRPDGAAARHRTTLLRAGVPVRVVATRLGHADPSVTLRVYAHVISKQLAEAAVIFADAVGSV